MGRHLGHIKANGRKAYELRGPHACATFPEDYGR
jgi:hypothetical protein